MANKAKVATQFDSMVAAGETGKASLTAALAEVFRALDRPRPRSSWGTEYEDRVVDEDAGRLVVLAALTGDERLWKRVLDYLIERDGAHRFGQKMSGTPKEDLGPHPTPARAAVWALWRGQSALEGMPERVAAPLVAIITRWHDQAQQSR